MKTIVLNLTVLSFILFASQTKAQVSVNTDSVCLTGLSKISVKGILKSDIKYCYWDLNKDSIYNDATGDTITYEFKQAGTYPVRVKIVKKDNSVVYNLVETYSVVYPLPEPNFIVNNLCEGEFATFTDSSKIKSGSIKQRTWDIYDNDIPDRLNDLVFTFNCGPAKDYNTRLEAISDKGCVAFTIKNTMVYAKPKVDFIVPVICKDAPTSFVNSTDSNGVSINLYIWEFADGSASSLKQAKHTFTTAGNESVTLIAMNTGGCSDTIKKTMIINTLPASIDTTLTIDKQIVFTPNVSASTYKWSSGESTQGITLTSLQIKTTYTLTATDNKGCSNTSSLIVLEKEILPISNKINKVITPNGDGINETLIITGIQSPISLVVYNSWGVEVFNSTNYNNDWDASGAEAGSYYYVVKTDAEEIKGNINILK